MIKVKEDLDWKAPDVPPLSIQCKHKKWRYNEPHSDSDQDHCPTGSYHSLVDPFIHVKTPESHFWHQWIYKHKQSYLDEIEISKRTPTQISKKYFHICERVKYLRILCCKIVKGVGLSFFVDVHAEVARTIAESYAHKGSFPKKSLLGFFPKRRTCLWLMTYVFPCITGILGELLKADWVKNDLIFEYSNSFFCKSLVLVILDGKVGWSIQGQLDKLCHLGLNLYWILLRNLQWCTTWDIMWWSNSLHHENWLWSDSWELWSNLLMINEPALSI